METESPNCDLIRRLNADVLALALDSGKTTISFGLHEPLAYERFELNL
jgi:hypothetical protein